MRKILVTAISGDIGNGILKILKAEDNVLYGCDVNEIAVGMDLVEVFWQSRYAVDAGYIDELLEKCEQYGITHLIPVNEREIERVSKERQRFEKKGIKLVIQEPEILSICLDKWKTAEKLASYGMDVPATYLDIREVDGQDGRYICKPRKSNGSKDIFIYSPKDETMDVPTGDYVIQEYIDSEEEYTVGVYRQDQVVNVIAFKRQLKNGYSHQVELEESEALNKLAHTIADRLDLKGYINIQLRKKGDRYYIFEINPRISGTVRFRHMLGYSDVIWWLNMLDGKKVTPYQCQYHKAVGIRELNEKYLILE